jgi:hypothetical protein
MGLRRGYGVCFSRVWRLWLGIEGGKLREMGFYIYIYIYIYIYKENLHKFD